VHDCLACRAVQAALKRLGAPVHNTSSKLVWRCKTLLGFISVLPLVRRSAGDGKTKAESQADTELSQACAVLRPGQTVSTIRSMVSSAARGILRYRVIRYNSADRGSSFSTGIPQMTVLVTTIASFLCHRIAIPGSSTHSSSRARTSGRCRQLPVQYRTEPAIDGWRRNGPNYVAAPGTELSVTHPIRELRGQGPQTTGSQRVDQGAPRSGCRSFDRTCLAEVYNLGENSDFQDRYQFAQSSAKPCLSRARTSSCQGMVNWWGFGATWIYSHTRTPKETLCIP